MNHPFQCTVYLIEINQTEELTVSLSVNAFISARYSAGFFSQFSLHLPAEPFSGLGDTARDIL